MKISMFVALWSIALAMILVTYVECGGGWTQKFQKIQESGVLDKIAAKIGKSKSKDSTNESDGVDNKEKKTEGGIKEKLDKVVEKQGGYGALFSKGTQLVGKRMMGKHGKGEKGGHGGYHEEREEERYEDEYENSGDYGDDDYDSDGSDD